MRSWASRTAPTRTLLSSPSRASYRLPPVFANTLLTAVFQYSAIVFAAGFGLAFFDEPVGLMSAAGIAVILVSGVWAAVIAKKKS